MEAETSAIIAIAKRLRFISTQGTRRVLKTTITKQNKTSKQTNKKLVFVLVVRPNCYVFHVLVVTTTKYNKFCLSQSLCSLGKKRFIFSLSLFSPSLSWLRIGYGQWRLAALPETTRRPSELAAIFHALLALGQGHISASILRFSR